MAIAADGAGSALCAEEGAGLACATLNEEVGCWLAAGCNVMTITRDVADEWMAGVRSAIESRAAEKQLAVRDFACTIVAAVVDDTAAAFLQIGDGAIICGSGDSYDVVFWPDGGEYANMTFFVTDDDWTEHLHFDVRDSSFEDLGVMTDGLQRLALHFGTRSAHAPFFVPMFRALAEQREGYAADLEAQLLAFLSGDVVNERTDDDKTLVLATRRRGLGSEAGAESHGNP